ncbi:PAS domain S-box protein [Massilia sp. YIM B02443]|uniref:hybrid sensor histidine kinase/response regulator n=1 Tax=Massilia sp. YIM B02443 TaxID=3050127 RepID=UPI0025B65A8D|nr:PAS domain S-box protein [Massilia sp. YIM B02443]MDN4036430.1 PAS domain S-box protein [Massilia sp. YIM B02443]
MPRSSSNSLHDLSSDQRYRLLVDHAFEHALVVTDEKGVIVEWSVGAERLLGWDAQETIGQPIAMIFTPEDREANAPQEELFNALALGRSSDVRWHLRKDGTSVFCDGIVNKLLDPHGRHLLGYGKVLREAYSSRKYLPEQHAHVGGEQRSFLAAVLESVESGVVACDRQGKLTFFNEAAQEIHGLEAEPLSSAHWSSHYHLYRPDGKTLLPVEEIPLQRALRGERVEAARIVVRTPAGRQRDIEVNGRALRDGAGNILGAVISMHDVSARRQVQAARDETTRVQTLRDEGLAAHEQLRKAEEQLRVATEAARLGIWTWQVAHGSGTWENERMYDIFGVPPEQPALDPLRLIAEYLHPDDAEAFRQSTRVTVEERGRFSFVGRIQPRDRQPMRWIELTGELAPRLYGDTDVIIGTAADITERKEIEQTLEDARLRLNATLSAGEVGTWIWDIRQDRIRGDGNLADLFGVAPEAVAEATLAVYLGAVHPDHLNEVLRQIRHSVDTGEPYFATYRIRHPEEGYRWVSARGRVERDEEGNPALLAGVILNITEQKQAQEALEQAEERYRTLITSMDEAFSIVQVLLDADGRPADYRFEQVNRAFEEQSGLVDAAGKTIREMVPGIEARWIEIYGAVALKREPVRFTEHSAAMGYWWDVYATPIGKPEERRIAILFTDITARRAAEEALRQTAADLSETNRRKTEFLATLAHELRNPLAPMRTGLDLLRLGTKEGQGGPGNTRVMDMMDRQLRQMVHLIDDLMDVSRISSGKIVLKRERIDLGQAIANAVETALPAAEAARHALTVDLADGGLEVEADATRLAQVLSNLLTNAVKYTPPGGRIRVSVRRDGDAASVAVSDSGMGIPREEQARVFDMFSQVSRNMGRAQGGLGIGLSLVRSLVEMHGGSIAVRSAGAGQGSTFTVTLPLASAAGAQSTPASGVAPDGGARHAALRIVVADDNVDAALMLGSLLEAAGHHAETVHDGVQALHRIDAIHPDVAILDIGMPGLNGYEVAQQVRATPGRRDTILIALTGWGGELDRSRSGAAGFDAHLTKPAGLDELDRLIAGIVAQRAARQR